MSSTLNLSSGATRDVTNLASDGTAYAGSGDPAKFLDAVKVVAQIASALRGVDAALDWVGVGRKRGPVGALALFSAGVAVGAGAGALLAPSPSPEPAKAPGDKAPGDEPPQLRRERFGWLLPDADEKPGRAEPNRAAEFVRKVEDTLGDHARAVKVALRNIDSMRKPSALDKAGDTPAS
jgi:hypothetical protein